MNNPDDKLTGKYIRKFVNLRIYERYESMKFLELRNRRWTRNVSKLEEEVKNKFQWNFAKKVSSNLSRVTAEPNVPR